MMVPGRTGTGLGVGGGGGRHEDLLPYVCLSLVLHIAAARLCGRKHLDEGLSLSARHDLDVRLCEAAGARVLATVLFTKHVRLRNGLGERVRGRLRDVVQHRGIDFVGRGACVRACRRSRHRYAVDLNGAEAGRYVKLASREVVADLGFVDGVNAAAIVCTGADGTDNPGKDVRDGLLDVVSDDGNQGGVRCALRAGQRNLHRIYALSIASGARFNSC